MEEGGDMSHGCVIIALVWYEDRRRPGGPVADMPRAAMLSHSRACDNDAITPSFPSPHSDDSAAYIIAPEENHKVTRKGK